MGKFISEFNRLSKEIERNPDNAEAYYNRGILVYTYECDFENSPYQDEDENEDEWDDINEDLALSDFDKAISLKPDFAVAYAMRGCAYWANADYDEALFLDDFNKALSLDKNCKEAYLGLGDYYEDKEEYELAIENYTKAIEIDKDYLAAYKRRADVYSYTKEDNDDKKIEDYNEILEHEPANYQFYFKRAEELYYKKEYEAALSDYSKAIELDVKNLGGIWNYLHRAEVYEELGNNEAALADLDKAVSIAELEDSQQDSAYSARARFYANQNDLKNALEDYTKAIIFSPDYFLNYYNIAEIYEQQGDTENAIRYYEKVTELNTDGNSFNSMAKEAIDRLKESPKGGKGFFGKVKDLFK